MLPEFVVEQLRRDLPRDAANVLDVGARDGRYLEFLHTCCPRAAVWGVDRFPRGGNVLRADAETLSGIPSRSIDAITMIEVIEHVEHPERALRACARVLKPCGLLCLVTPNYPWKRLYDIRRGRWRDDPTHVSPMSARRLLRLLGECFTVLRIIGSAVLGEGWVPALRHLRASRWGHLVSNKVYVLATPK